jgi:threonine/homoserine/homoserine lactone efflux protein
MAKLWCPEDNVWLTFAGGLLLLWAAFRAWDSQRQLAQKSSPDSLRHELAELKLQLAQQKRRRLTSDQRSHSSTRSRILANPFASIWSIIT